MRRKELITSVLPNTDKRKQVTNHQNLTILMFLDWTWHVLLPGRVLSRNTHPAKRYLSQDIMILHLTMMSM